MPCPWSHVPCRPHLTALGDTCHALPTSPPLVTRGMPSPPHRPWSHVPCPPHRCYRLILPPLEPRGRWAWDTWGPNTTTEGPLAGYNGPQHASFGYDRRRRPCYLPCYIPMLYPPISPHIPPYLTVSPHISGTRGAARGCTPSAAPPAATAAASRTSSPRAWHPTALISCPTRSPSRQCGAAIDRKRLTTLGGTWPALPLGHAWHALLITPPLVTRGMPSSSHRPW